MDRQIYGGKREMINLVLYAVFGNLLFLASCASSVSQKEENIPLAFIENFLENGGNLKKVKEVFGEPDEKIKFKGDREMIYEYRNKKYKGREWNFGIGHDKKLLWINYRPWGNPLLGRVEILPRTLKKYNCQKKTKPDTRVSHVIEDFTFFECAGGKIRAYYNFHGEISSIVVIRRVAK